MTAWHEEALGALCREVTVGYVSKMSDQYVADGIPFLRSQDILPGFICKDNLKFVSTEFHRKIKKSSLSPGDVVIVRTGYPGTAAVVPSSLTHANCADLVIARPGSRLNPHFLAYVLNSPWGKGQIGGRLVGVAQQHFNVKVAKALKIPVPSFSEQQRIVSVLGAYDELIEVNGRRISLLEEIGRRLFEEWFVRVWEENRDVLPADWRPGTASDLIDFDPRTQLPRTGLKPFIPMASLNTRNSTIDSIEEREVGNGAKFQNGDTLFARITPCLENGKTGIVRDLPGDGAGFGSTEFIVMRGRTAGPAFTYLLARHAAFRAHAQRSMSGASGRQRARAESLRGFELALPPSALSDRFEKVTWPMLQMAGCLSSANKTLAASRDLLLPRLISGELSVATAERDLEAAA